MVLQKPVYKVKEECDLNRLYKERKVANAELNKALAEISKKYPLTDQALGVWSESQIGIRVGTNAEKEFDSELKKGYVQGFRPFKKTSKTAKLILEEYGNIFKNNSHANSGFRFELVTFFGINNVKRIQTIEDIIYLNLDRGLEDHAEMLEEIDYPDYLGLCIELEKEK